MPTRSLAADKAFDVFSADCPSRAALAHATGRWGALTLAALTGGSMRFGAVRRHVGGISEKMLSQTLQELERDGLVHRAVLSEMPPNVEYSLTMHSEAMAAKVLELIEVLYATMAEDPR